MMILNIYIFFCGFPLAYILWPIGERLYILWPIERGEINNSSHSLDIVFQYKLIITNMSNISVPHRLRYSRQAPQDHLPHWKQGSPDGQYFPQVL